jgi:Asp-tRNA(Asn)/Glu-tRNA(Gln) amidotransferase A subunit family amidase
VPAGLDAHGHPRAVQLIGTRWSEALLLAVAGELETRLPRSSPPD